MPRRDGQGSLMAPDMMYFITFALGMGAFWVSGQAVRLLPYQSNRGLATILSLLTTSLIYGLVLAAWTAITSRGLNLKRTILAVVPAILLAYGAAQIITRLAAGKITNLMSLGILTFVLFVCYGLIYVLSLALARRLAR